MCIQRPLFEAFVHRKAPKYSAVDTYEWYKSDSAEFGSTFVPCFWKKPVSYSGGKISFYDRFFFFWNSVTKFWKCKKKPGPKIKPTERKRTRLEASTSNNFDTLFKKGQRSATENNRAEIWSNQIYWILFVLWDLKFPPLIYLFIYFLIPQNLFFCEILTAT